MIAKYSVYTLLYVLTLFLVISSLFLTIHPFSIPALSGIRAIIIFFSSVLLIRYTLYMFLAPWQTVLQKRNIHRHKNRSTPLVSVMIPAWNEEVGLLPTIKSLLKSTYKNIEIIVVNDGSTDGSDAMMRAFLRKYEQEVKDVPIKQRIAITYYYQENGGKGTALNTAIILSYGDILMSIDADCIVDEYCIESFVEAFQDPKTMAAVGNVRIGNTKTLIGTIQYLEFLFGFFLKKSDSIMNTIYIIGGAAGAFRKEVFDKLGGYNTKNITEDIELSIRIQNQGWKIVYCPDSIVLTEGASTLSGLMKQRLRWKRGRFQTFWEYRHLFFSRDHKHNKMLCWAILPLALFSEMQLALEPLFLLILYIFSFLTGDFSAFLSGIAVVTLMFCIQALDDKRKQTVSYIALAPIGWLLFYACTFVEFYSLFKAIFMMIQKKEIVWQRWTRSGAV